MQTKTISKRIRNKMEDWIKSIKNEDLRLKLKKDIIVTGGCIPSMFLNEDVNDYDVYIRTYSTLLKLVSYYIDDAKKQGVVIPILEGVNKEKLINDLESKYDDEIKEIMNAYSSALRTIEQNQIKLFVPSNTGGHKFIPKDGVAYDLAFISANAISLTDNLQIIIRFWGEPNEIHKNYDFVHATNYWTFKDGLVTNKEALTSILTKQLIYQGSLYPVTSILRIKKFTKRYWNISAGDTFKIIYQASLLDLSDMDVLETQLAGMDVAYFGILIEALRTVEDKSKITPGYLFELIDRIFNSENEDIE